METAAQSHYKPAGSALGKCLGAVRHPSVCHRHRSCEQDPNRLAPWQHYRKRVGHCQWSVSSKTSAKWMSGKKDRNSMKRWRQTDRWTGETGSGDGCFRSGRWGLVRVFSGYLLASRDPPGCLLTGFPEVFYSFQPSHTDTPTALSSCYTSLWTSAPCTHVHTRVHTCSFPSVIL